MIKKKYIHLSALCFLVLLLLTACDQKPYTQKDVEEYVQEHFPGAVLIEITEEYIEDQEDAKSRNQYTYKTEQGIEFHVYTSLSRDPIFLAFSRFMDDDYVRQVFVHKEDLLNRIYEKYGFQWEEDEDRDIVIKDFNEIKNVSQLIAEIYTEIYPMFQDNGNSIPVKYIYAMPSSRKYLLTQFPLGARYADMYTEEFFQNIMEFKYVSAVVNEEIEDPSLAEETIKNFPQESLELILVNHAEEVFPITKDTIVYDLMSGKYILPICSVDSSEEYRLNSLTEIQQEILLRYYPNADYTVDADTSNITYTINGNKYEINRHESEGYEFIKNGEKLDISLIKNSNWLKTKESGCSGYSIHLEDFAQIMEMDFESVQGNSVYFTTKDVQ